MSVLPIITPPFVIGLALILLFGRSGAAVRRCCATGSACRARAGSTACPACSSRSSSPSRRSPSWCCIGVVQGISPTLEEASQTLRAKSWTTFRTVTLPLMRPGLANAFLLGFVESLADFGNPLVLGGNFEVLSTKIFFAVVGAQQDQGRAAVLSIVLLAFTLGAFWLQHAWLGKKVYTTVTGKGDAGIPLPLPRRVALASYLTAIPWALFTVVIYAIIRRRRLRALHGPRLHADPRAFPHRLPRRARRLGPLLLRLGLELVLRHHQGRRALRAAHRRHRPAHRLSADAPALLRPARLRVRHAAELRHPRHGRRRVLHPRLQRAADRDHRHGLHPRDVLRVPQHAGGRALRHRHLEPDRQEPRRGLADAGRALVHHHAPRGAAAAAAGDRRVAGLFLRARHDRGERRDLPRHRRVQHGDRPISSAASRRASSASPSPIPPCSSS